MKRNPLLPVCALLAAVCIFLGAARITDLLDTTGKGIKRASRAAAPCAPYEKGGETVHPFPLFRGAKQFSFGKYSFGKSDSFQLHYTLDKIPDKKQILNILKDFKSCGFRLRRHIAVQGEPDFGFSDWAISNPAEFPTPPIVDLYRRAGFSGPMEDYVLMSRVFLFDDDEKSRLYGKTIDCLKHKARAGEQICEAAIKILPYVSQEEEFRIRKEILRGNQ